ncbi:ABC transporter permease [Breznakiellaceae bacterium SP9]
MIWHLVLRNIIRSKKNSGIILLLIAVITFLFFIGNSIIGQADRGLRQVYVESLTADVMIQKSAEVSMNLFGANAPGIDSYFKIPSLPAYDAIMKILEAEPGVSGITSQVSSQAYLDVLGVRAEALLCGVDAQTYFSLFPGIIVEEGRTLNAGEYGAMISTERADRIAEESGIRPSIGLPLLFTSGGDMGFKIREVPLIGIYRYQNPGQFMNEIVIIDPQTARVLSAIQVASSDVEVAEEALSLLETDLGAIFDSSSSGESAPLDEGFSVDILESFLSGSRNTQTEAAVVGGDWNFILLRLAEGSSAARVIASLNKKLDSYGVFAADWRTAAGTSALLLLVIQSLFNIGVGLISIAGILVIINLLLIAVFRRTRELGTLRAIGASDGYIRSLILGENCTLAALAGIAGLIGGLLFLHSVNGIEVVIPNELLASLLGGSVINVTFMPSVALSSIGVAIVLGFLASLYPVEIAVRTPPIVALQKG